MRTLTMRPALCALARGQRSMDMSKTQARAVPFLRGNRRIGLTIGSSGEESLGLMEMLFPSIWAARRQPEAGNATPFVKFTGVTCPH